ncbi:MAG: Response regulator PleD [Planctomycetes bacterium ADurb.Bin412]|nr:MAG: Response regulator PleD [Planctomycetes bacterium ADurb.Bin412]
MFYIVTTLFASYPPLQTEILESYKLKLDGGRQGCYNAAVLDRNFHSAMEYGYMTESAGQQDTPSKVLIVDDNPQNAELLQAYLEPMSYDILIAADGLEALEKIETFVPDIILLDIMMPRMSGFEVCKRIKKNPKTADIPVVMVTALNELGDIERGVDCGADDFLSKPINKLELVTRVKSLLRVRHLKGELERTLTYLADIENEESNNIQA